MDTIRKHLHETVEAFKEAMVVKNCPMAKTLPELLNFISSRLEMMHLGDPRIAELRVAVGLLQKAEIIAEGGTPLMRVCQYCKIIFGAKAGGEAYPEGMRLSHGCCPSCLQIEEAKINDAKKDACPICTRPGLEEFTGWGDKFCSKDCLESAGRDLERFGS